MTSKDVVMPFARELRSSSYTKTAIMHGQNVSYVKGSKALQFFTEHKKMTLKQAQDMCTLLLTNQLVTKCESQDAKKRLLRPCSQASDTFEEKAFLVWNFESSNGMRNLLLLIIVISFFGLVLFPVWPQKAKVGVGLDAHHTPNADAPHSTRYGM
jgi:hypothetical protein